MSNTIGNSIEMLLEQKTETVLQAKVSKKLRELVEDDARKNGLSLSGWMRLAVSDKLKK